MYSRFSKCNSVNEAIDICIRNAEDKSWDSLQWADAMRTIKMLIDADQLSIESVHREKVNSKRKAVDSENETV